MYNWFDAPFFGVFRVRAPILIIRDPKLIKSVLVKDFNYFVNRGIPTNFQDPLSCHLFNLEGDKWRNLRTKLTSAFSEGKIKKMVILLQECSGIFEKLINEASISNAPVDVRELTVNFMIDVIGSCAFGIQINALTEKESEFHRAAKKISKPGFKSQLWRLLRTSIPQVYKFLGIQINDPNVTKFFQDVVKQMVALRESDGSRQRRNDFMDLLVDLKRKNQSNRHSDQDNIEFDENMIAPQAYVFFVAGYETSSNTIAFCLYELATNKEIQNKVKAEIALVMKKHKELTYESIKEMKYLEKVILETLRKYPPAATIGRKCENTYKLPGTILTIPAGMRVIIPVYGIHHDPNYYPEPDKFNPDRFDDNNIQIFNTFLPFGEGPRSCIGIRFAKLSMKFGLISFLKNHRVELSDKTITPIKFTVQSMVTSSKNGIWLNIHRDN
ncbi:hypothetical protein KQX54_012629 [Cotesia glomerata]|uniref:Cytochrome P450 n=2 Tax=Cotesia glomerata TaxID=32391 RepID=A0AAV7IXR6_COTGL|nr:hypothetical protein KQX54_012629 [Cotesia glomerata]